MSSADYDTRERDKLPAAPMSCGLNVGAPLTTDPMLSDRGAAMSIDACCCREIAAAMQYVGRIMSGTPVYWMTFRRIWWAFRNQTRSDGTVPPSARLSLARRHFPPHVLKQYGSVQNTARR
jgi:hypothetical protein